MAKQDPKPHNPPKPPKCDHCGKFKEWYYKAPTCKCPREPKKPKKKIYIAGKVTGEYIPAVIGKFDKAQIELEKAGFEAVNPLDVVGDWKATWQEAMRKCIKALMDCDAVYILPCADNSRGAKVERELVEALDIPYFLNLKMLQQWKNN